MHDVFLTRTAPEKDVGLFVVDFYFLFFRENGRKRLTGAGRRACIVVRFSRIFVF